MKSKATCQTCCIPPSDVGPRRGGDVYDHLSSLQQENKDLRNEVECLQKDLKKAKLDIHTMEEDIKARLRENIALSKKLQAQKKTQVYKKDIKEWKPTLYDYYDTSYYGGTSTATNYGYHSAVRRYWTYR